MTHSVTRPPVASSKLSNAAMFVAALSVGIVIAGTLPAAAQRAPDDSRPGGVEVRPSGPPPPAGADMSASPSMLFKKPTVTPPVLPTPAPAIAPAAAVAPVAPPPTSPSATVPAAEKPADTGKAGTKPPAPAEIIKKLEKGPADGLRTRSFRYEAPSAPRPAGSATDGAPAPGSGKMGDDRLPGGVERSPGRE